MSNSGNIRSDQFAFRAASAPGSDNLRAYGAAQQAGADLKDFFAILRRHWIFILACILGALTLAGAYLATASTAYTSTVSILIDARARPQLGAEQNAGPVNIPDATLVESQVKLIASDTVLRRVAQRETLIDDPEFVPTKPGLRTRLLAMLGMGATAPAGEDRLTRATMALARTIAVKRTERTYVIDVELNASNPHKAARLANFVAEAYIEDQRDARAQVSQQGSKWLNQRLLELHAKLQGAENKIQDYKVKNQISDAVGKNMREQEFADLTTEVGRASARTIEAKAKYDQVQKLAASGRAPEETADALKSPVLEKLRAQFSEIARQEAHYRTTLGDRHPAMLEVQNQLRHARQLIAAELKRIAGAAANEYQQARIAEAETARRAENARLSTDTKNQHMVQLRELERELEAHRGVYEKFLRARETMSDDNNDGPNARIIAPASPPLSSSAPKTLAILFIALASGLCFGVGGALLREYLGGEALQSTAPPQTQAASAPEAGPPDTSTPRANVAFGDRDLHLIASVPRAGEKLPLKQPKWTGAVAAQVADAAANPNLIFSEVANNPNSSFSQAIAELLHALTPPAGHSAGPRRVMTVLVCSNRAQCGKTTIAVNLARAAAMSGHRALLIDANFDNPSLGDLIEADAEPALIELAGAMRPIYRLVERSQGELRAVPIFKDESKVRRELAEHDEIERLRGINDNFDLVVIDGPTLNAREQLRHLASSVNRIVFITEPGETAPRINDLLDGREAPRERSTEPVVAMADTRQAA